MIKELSGETVYPDVADFKNTEGFRLPTELEWEWFARGGQVAIDSGTFDYTYAGSNNINEVAWCEENSGGNKNNYDNTYSGGATQDVGLKKPNQLGLYDCSGNVWEWCYDTTKGIENGSSYIYKAFDSSNIYRRLRGGSWYNNIKECEIFNHYSNEYINLFSKNIAIKNVFVVENNNNNFTTIFSKKFIVANNGIGFRLVRTI